MNTTLSEPTAMLVELLSAMYILAGVVGNLAYLPTIRDLWLLQPVANLQSFVIWSLTSSLVFAYAIAVNGDRIFIALSCLTLCLCTTVVVLEIRRQQQEFRKSADALADE